MYKIMVREPRVTAYSGPPMKFYEVYRENNADWHTDSVYEATKKYRELIGKKYPIEDIILFKEVEVEIDVRSNG
jgi:hypothetical protein